MIQRESRRVLSSSNQNLATACFGFRCSSKVKSTTSRKYRPTIGGHSQLRGVHRGPLCYGMTSQTTQGQRREFSHCLQHARHPSGSCRASMMPTEPSAQQHKLESVAHITEAGTLTSPSTAVEDGTENWSTSDGEFQTICKNLDEQITRFVEENHKERKLASLQVRITESLDSLAEALRRYNYEELSFSYNGGKDCLVLLILYLVALHRYFSAKGTPIPASLKSIYIQPSHPFPQVTDFVQTSSAYYHICLASSSLPMKQAFAEYLQNYPEVKLIFVGTRRTDPHGADLTHFDMTDGGWPRFMRCHPVIDWHYQDIWTFIRHFEIPYCSLYDDGYTSLGGTTDTNPNPALKQDQSNKLQYKPAYMLEDDDEERLGRE